MCTKHMKTAKAYDTVVLRNMGHNKDRITLSEFDRCLPKNDSLTTNAIGSCCVKPGPRLQCALSSNGDLLEVEVYKLKYVSSPVFSTLQRRHLSGATV